MARDKALPTPDLFPFEQYCYGAVEMHNWILSGGSVVDRSMATASLLMKARQLGLSVVALHCSNPFFGAQAQSRLWNEALQVYDPLSGKTPTQIADILTDVGVNALEADKRIFVLIELVAEILAASAETATLSTVLDFPINSLLKRLEILESDDVISPKQRKDFTDRYSGAASECVAETRRLFSRLKNAWKAQPQAQRYVSLQEAIDAQKIISFDLVTDTNPVLKELLFSDINAAMQRGSRFLLIADGLSILGKDSANTDMVLLRNHDNISLVYSAADVPQMAMHKDEYFYTLTGGIANLVLFRHNNAESAKKWSNFFGQEWAEITGTTVTDTREKYTFFQGSTGTTESKQWQRIDKFPPERFTDIPFGLGKGYLVHYANNGQQEIRKAQMPMLREDVLQCLMK